MKVFLVIAVILICSQSSFGQKVKGKVIDNSYFPIPGVDIEIEGGGSSETDNNGEFSVDVKKIPYTITLISKEYSMAVRYESVTELNPELKLFTNVVNKYSNQEYITVDFPKVPENNEGIIQFLSNEVCISKASTVKGGKSSTLLNVKWPLEKESIQGYIVYLEKSGGEYTKYFQYKTEIIRKPLFRQRIVIPQNFISINPGTSTITIFPFGNIFHIYADFPGLGRSEGIILSSTLGDDGKVTATVPSVLPFDYRLNLKIGVRGKNGSGSGSSLYISPNSTTLVPKQGIIPQINEPLGGLADYDSDTRFSYSQGFGFGVYVVCFSTLPSPFSPPTPPAPPSPPTYNSFFIVTTKQTVKHPLENSYGILKGNNFIWYVSNYSGFRNVNEFVKPFESGKYFEESTVTYSERKNIELKY